MKEVITKAIVEEKTSARKSWKDLTAEEMEKLTAKSACMYGRKAGRQIM